MCSVQHPSAFRDTKNRHPLFSECRFCYLIVRLIFWRKWRKFGVNPLLHAPKIKCSCGFGAVISTCRPFLYTVHVVSGSLQFQFTTKNEIGNPFWGSLSHFFVGAILQQPLVARSSYPTQKLPRLPVTETGAVCYTLFVLFIHVFSSSRAIICGDF